MKGQLESVERALGEDAPCVDVLQRLAAARGAINSLMAELMEDHILHHMGGKRSRPKMRPPISSRSSGHI